MNSTESSTLGPSADIPDKRLILLALACLVLSGVVFACRGLSAFQSAQISPGIAVTSGYEEESWFALWRGIQGQSVYGDPHRLPFASAYFNWLFYAVYQTPIASFAKDKGGEVIPLVGRLFSAAWALLGLVTLSALIRRILGHASWLPAAGLASLVFLGPLVGWWAHTVRPDIGALALETAALSVLLVSRPRHALIGGLFAAVLFYSAWAFKQTYVMGLGTALLFLAYRRDWRSTGLLVVVSLGLWVATFSLQSAAYRASFAANAITNVYYLSHGIRNFAEMLLKTAPLWLLVTGLIVRPRCATRAPARSLPSDAVRLGSLGLLVSLPLGFAASCKLGAASYYHLSALVMLALVASGLIATRPDGLKNRMLSLALLTGTGLQMLALTGFAGTIHLRAQSTRLDHLWSHWQHEPEPRFSHLTGFNLPWVSPNSPPLIVAYNYRLERAAGQPFERDGVGGLITEGYFRSLLLPDNTGGAYDGGSLVAYDRGETIDGLTIFRRKSTSLP